MALVLLNEGGGTTVPQLCGCTTAANEPTRTSTALAITHQDLQGFGARVPSADNQRHTPTNQPSFHPLQGGEGADRVPRPAAASPLPAGRRGRAGHPRHARCARSDRELRAPYNPASKRNAPCPHSGKGPKRQLGEDPIALDNFLKLSQKVKRKPQRRRVARRKPRSGFHGRF